MFCCLSPCSSGHVYLLRFMNHARKEHVYKIGRTTQENPLNRLRNYPPVFKLLMISAVSNAKSSEHAIIRAFKNDKNMTLFDRNEYFKTKKCDDYVLKLFRDTF